VFFIAAKSFFSIKKLCVRIKSRNFENFNNWKLLRINK